LPQLPNTDPGIDACIIEVDDPDSPTATFRNEHPPQLTLSVFDTRCYGSPLPHERQRFIQIRIDAANLQVHALADLDQPLRPDIPIVARHGAFRFANRPRGE
jgi:hypothetical protein